MKSIENFIFNIDIPTGEPQKGSLLVSEPFLKEEWFSHSVICLIEHEKNSSSMGVVMNRRIPFSLQKLMDGVERREKIPVYCGGPMSRDRLFFIHRLGDVIPDSRQVTDDLYVSGDFRVMKEYINSGEPLEGRIRFFVGYSGWERHQLEGEIANRIWAVTAIANARSLLTGYGDAYWHRYVRSMGDPYKGWLYHPENIHQN